MQKEKRKVENEGGKVAKEESGKGNWKKSVLARGGGTLAQRRIVDWQNGEGP